MRVARINISTTLLEMLLELPCDVRVVRLYKDTSGNPANFWVTLESNRFNEVNVGDTIPEIQAAISKSVEWEFEYND